VRDRTEFFDFEIRESDQSKWNSGDANPEQHRDEHEDPYERDSYQDGRRVKYEKSHQQDLEIFGVKVQHVHNRPYLKAGI
jgi:hypothetical protein